MTKYIIITLSVFLFCGILYWAYLPDYNRNPKEFWRTIIGMPLSFMLTGLSVLITNVFSYSTIGKLLIFLLTLFVIHWVKHLILKWAIRDKDKSNSELN